MALSGFMQSGYYSIVVLSQYDKFNKNLAFTVLTYEDNSKAKLISQNTYSLLGDITMTEVISKAQSVPPVSPAADDQYIVGAAAIGVWATHEDELARWDGAAWGFIDISAENVYVTDESKIYRWTGSGWVHDPDAFCSYTFDSTFSIADLNPVNQNLIERIYVYLKTRSEFAGVSDV